MEIRWFDIAATRWRSADTCMHKQLQLGSGKNLQYIIQLHTYHDNISNILNDEMLGIFSMYELRQVLSTSIK